MYSNKKRNIGKACDPHYAKLYYEKVIRDKKNIISRDKYIAYCRADKQYHILIKLCIRQLNLISKIKAAQAEFEKQRLIVHAI